MNIAKSKVFTIAFIMAMIVTMLPTFTVHAADDDDVITVTTADEIKTAIAEAEGPTTIKFGNDIEYDDGRNDGIAIPEGKDITVDLNGHSFSHLRTIVEGHPYRINALFDNSGKLTIGGGGTLLGGAETGLSVLRTSNGSGVLNNSSTGELILNDVTITTIASVHEEYADFYEAYGIDPSGYAENYGIIVRNRGSLTINDGNYTGKLGFIGGSTIEETYLTDLGSQSQGSFTMNGGTVNGNLTLRSKDVTIAGGTVNGNVTIPHSFREDVEEQNINLSGVQINGGLSVKCDNSASQSKKTHEAEVTNLNIGAGVMANTLTVDGSASSLQVNQGVTRLTIDPSFVDSGAFSEGISISNATLINDINFDNASVEGNVTLSNITGGNVSMEDATITGAVTISNIPDNTISINGLTANGNVTLKNVKTEDGTLSGVKCSILKLTGTNIDTLDSVETDKGTYTSNSLVKYYGVETDKGLTITNSSIGTVYPTGTQTGQVYDIGGGTDIEYIGTLDGTSTGNKLYVHDGATITNTVYSWSKDNEIVVDNASISKMGAPLRPMATSSITVNDGTIGTIYHRGNLDVSGNGVISELGYYRTNADEEINVEQPTTVKRIRQYRENEGATGIVTVNLPDGYKLDEQGYVRAIIASDDKDNDYTDIEDALDKVEDGDTLTIKDPSVSPINTDKNIKVTNGTDSPIVVNGVTVDPGDTYDPSNPIVAKDDKGNPYVNIEDAINGTDEDGTLIIKDPSVSPIDTGDKNIKVKNDTEEPIVVNGVTVDPGDTYDPNNVVVAKDEKGNGYTDIDDAIDSVKEGDTVIVKDPSVSPIETEKDIYIKNDTTEPIVVNGYDLEPGETINTIVAKEYKDLEDELEKLKEEKEAAEQALEDLKETSEQEKENLENQISTLEERIGTLEEDKANLEEELSDTKDELATTKQEKENALNEINDKNAQIEDLEGQIDELKSQLEDAEDANEELTNQVNALSEELADVKDEKQELEDKVEELEDKIDELEEQVGNLNEEIEAKDDIITSLREDKEDLKEKVEKLTEDNEKLEQDKQNLQNQIEEANNAIESLQAVLDDKNSTIEELQGKLDNANALVENLNNSVEELTTLNTQLQTDKQNLQDKIDELNEKINTLTNELNDTKEQLNDKIKENDDLKNEVDKLKDEKDKLQQEIDELKKKVNNTDKSSKRKIFIAHQVHFPKVVKYSKGKAKIRFADCMTLKRAKLLPTKYKVYVKVGKKYKKVATVKPGKQWKKIKGRKNKYRVTYATLKKLKKGQKYKIKIVAFKKINGKMTRNHGKTFTFRQAK